MLTIQRIKIILLKQTKKKKITGGALPSLLNMATHHTGH